MDTATAQIIGPDGEVATKPTRLLSSEDAELLRRYKKFLVAHGLREALYCDTCWDRQLSDGCKAFVTNEQIVIECRCAVRYHRGATY